MKMFLQKINANWHYFPVKAHNTCWVWDPWSRPTPTLLYAYLCSDLL